MKNVIISLVIFFAMIGAMFFSLGYLNKVCDRMEQESDSLEELLSKEEWEQAMNSTNHLYEEWKKQSEIVPIFVNHAEVDILSNELMRLIQYVKCQNKDESLASTHVVKFYIDNIKSLQKVNLQNLF